MSAHPLPDIKMHQWTERIPVAGCAITHRIHVKNKPNTPITQEAYKTMLRSVVGSSNIHARQTGWQSGVWLCYYARAVLAFSAGILCWHCTKASENLAKAIMCCFITCSAIILYADWSIGVRSGAVQTL